MRTKAAGTVGYDQSGRKTLADDYEYVMFGKVFKFVEDTSGALRVAVHASYGGLLMQLTVRTLRASGLHSSSCRRLAQHYA